MNGAHLVLAAISLGVVGAACASLVPGARGRWLGFAGLLLGGACAMAASAVAVHSGTASLAGWGHETLRMDPLAGFFAGIVGSVAVLVGLYALGGRAPDERKTGRTAAGAVCVAFAACILACAADDVLLFIFAWELLALSFFWAIAFSGPVRGSARAGYFTLLVTHIAGTALVVALLALAHAGHSFAVPAVVAACAHERPIVRSALFVLLLVGFGAKFGMLPMHAWLRYAYTAVPSSLAAFMAGGALNVGFYGLTRFAIPLGGPVPAWWAALVMTLGALAAVYGVALAAAQRDLRSLAAYSSVEHAGIVLAAFGAALAGRSTHNDVLFGLGLTAAFLQIAAHAFAKCGLFLGASALRERCGTTSFQRLGGLATRMRATTTVVLLGALSLAALPPLAGFAAEWLVLETMMQAFRTGSVVFETTMAVCGALVGLAAGIAIVAFVKVAGIAVLGPARSQAAQNASEVPSAAKRAAMLASAAAVAGIGLCCPNVVASIGLALRDSGGQAAANAAVATAALLQPGYSGFSSISPLGLLCDILGFAMLFWLVVHMVRRPARRIVSVWTSGQHYRSWTAYTGTGFANPTRVILDAMTRTIRSMTEDTYASDVQPYFGLQWYERIGKAFVRVGEAVRRVQSGSTAAYLAYILAFTLLLLLLYPSIRSW